jgi:hypothetical protein
MEQKHLELIKSREKEKTNNWGVGLNAIYI